MPHGGGRPRALGGCGADPRRARSFVPLTGTAQTLLAAIAALDAGRSYVPHDLASDLSRIGARAGAIGHAPLTERQREVLELIADGLSTREIAGSLGVSVKTAESHRSKLMDKIGVHKASSLVRMAIRQGLIGA